MSMEQWLRLMGYIFIGAGAFGMLGYVVLRHYSSEIGETLAASALVAILIGGILGTVAQSASRREKPPTD